MKWVLKGEGVPILIPSTEIIISPNPNDEIRNVPIIDLLNNPNPNLLFHSQIPVPKSLISISQLIRRQILVPNLPLPDPFEMDNVNISQENTICIKRENEFDKETKKSEKRIPNSCIAAELPIQHIDTQLVQTYLYDTIPC